MGPRNFVFNEFPSATGGGVGGTTAENCVLRLHFYITCLALKRI